MCIAVPVEVIKINGQQAVVSLGGISKEINISLIAELEVGDYVLLHSGCAIKKINSKAAQKTLDAVAELSREEVD